MVDLIIIPPAEEPASLFTRNFRIHSGIPIGLYEGGPRSPVAIVYGDISTGMLGKLSGHYDGLIGLPCIENDTVPEKPRHYETLTVKAPILATMQTMNRDGFTGYYKTYEGDPLVLTGCTHNKPTLLFTADLVKATIRILSGEMEQHTGRDSYGRHNPLPDNLTYAPAVSLHFNLIENAIRYLYKSIGLPLLSIPRWPSSAPLALFLSHDVDVVRKWTIKRSLYELFFGMCNLLLFRGARLMKTGASLYQAFRGRDPYWMYDELLIMEHGNGYKSTWFFAPFGGDYNVRENAFDPVYHRPSAEITAMIRRIVEKDCEIALHGTRGAFLDSETLKTQLRSFENRLGFKLEGVRFHYLMFRLAKTLQVVADSGLMYDATLGFSDRTGFRNGMASPYFPYPLDHPAGNVVEIPLNFMDTVFAQSQDSPEQTMRRITETYLYARAAGGLFSALVHPENMDPDEIPELSRFYHSLFTRFRQDKACSMTGIELARWWHDREQVLKSVEFGLDAWRIRGVNVPETMDFQITAPNIGNMRFVIEGAGGSSCVTNGNLTIKPAAVDPVQGITITRKN